MLFPSSGRRFAPKIRMTIMRMMISSGRPTLPSMIRHSSTFTAVLALTVGLAAQFRSGVNAVEVYAAVVDRNGAPVTGLTRADFTLLEDGTPQTISTFAEADFPLSVAVAIDRSFSMKQQLPGEVSAARAFLEELRPDDQAMIVAIGSDVETLAPLSTDRQAQVRALDT